MKPLHYARWGSRALGLLAMLVAMSVSMVAQQYYVIKGNAPNGFERPNYYYSPYPYPNNVYEANYSYMWYDYYDIYGEQFIVLADDMRKAGMCAGPISSMAFRFVIAKANPWGIKIGLKSLPASTTVLTGKQTGFTTVYDNQNFTMPAIAQNDSTWVDWKFSQNFIWDGVSNVCVEFCREKKTAGYNYDILGTQHLVTRVLPPENGQNYPGGSPSLYGYSYQYSPDNPKSCVNGPYYGYYTQFGYRYDYNNYIYEYYISFRPLLRFESGAGVVESFPDDTDPRRILKSGDNYNGSDANHPKPSLSFYEQLGQTASFTYRIVGPLPLQNVVYQGRQGGSSTLTKVGTSNGKATYTLSEATGTLAGPAGALNLTNAAGGTYVVEADFTTACGIQSWRKAFIVAFPNDVSMSNIRSPQPVPKKNPVNINLPLAFQIQNVGLNPVTDVDVEATVRAYPSGQIVYNGTFNWTGDVRTGDRASVDFPTVFTPTVAGYYTIEACTHLKGAIDDQADNDCLPRPGQTHIFEVNYNEEAGAGSILAPIPGQRYYVNRPLEPQATVVNGGILDLTDVPIEMEIFKLPSRTRVYNRTAIVPSVDAVIPLNIAQIGFPLFEPTETGDYEACITVKYPNDPVPGNDKICVNFSVEGALSGVYTIGTKNAGKERNYGTIQVAVDDLYRRGVSGPVTFELTDANYEVGQAGNVGPALDLTSAIIGTSSTNTVTFKPSLERSFTRSSVNIRLNSTSGIGIRMGQALVPGNQFSVARAFPQVRAYSNSNGYINFDGGLLKSLNFQLNATTAHRAVFYLNEGSRNISITNCLVNNSSTPSYASSLPRVLYLNGSFVFEEDSRIVNAQTQSYSAGIVNRARMPIGNSLNNSERLDTIINTNNHFVGNEISGFGYGVVSLGMGTLLKGGVNVFTPYYNTGTKIEDNLIYNVARAGIYAGYEDGVSINHNRIYNVGASTGASVRDAAGIYVGGTEQYNTMNAHVTRNEISGVRADSISRGIVVEQTRNGYPSVSSAGGMYYAPATNEHSVVMSNVVWGLARGTANGSAAGIHLLTRRRNNDLVTPFETNYFTRKDTIANNTVVMTNDNVTGLGALVGVGVQNSNGAYLTNNAIAMLGAANAAATTNSALFIEGILYSETRYSREYLGSNAPAPVMSDRNAFYTPTAGVARFVEISDNSELVSAGSQSEFETLNQWRVWTKQDVNSVEGNFVADHEYVGLAPKQSLRVKVSPQAPIGSILNNRGNKVAGLTTDIDGNVRGEAGSGYDIGADEFNGRLYVSDLEVVDILTPASYRSSTGTNSDAEYIMTKAPVNVTARLRNNGATSITNARVRVQVFMETPASNNAQLAAPAWSSSAVVDRTLTTAIASGASIDVNFNVPNWTPQVFFGLNGYTTPARFMSMASNVTPRYRVVVSTSNDEYAANNTREKTARFYIQKSGMSIVLSGRHTTANVATASANEKAGRLNTDSLMKAMADMGWINDPANGNYAYDVFDRGAWEERAVNYNIYRSLFWSHDQSAATRSERDDLRNFVAAGSSNDKRNLAIATQELPRRHVGLNAINDEAFIRRVLRVTNVNPGTPVPAPINSYHGRRVRGLSLTLNKEATVVRTGITGDADPLPALVRVYSDASVSGVANAANFYVKGDRITNDSIAGTTIGGLTANTVYLGIDWRHFARTGNRTGSELILRGIVDFFESNGGVVTPVELVNFDAKARGSNVDVFWATASERNSSRFDVERATVTEAGTSEFAQVSSVPAAGNTTDRRDYQVADLNVAAGQYLYRLNSVDLDGSSARSSEVLVQVGDDGQALWIGDITPNPVVSAATINFGYSSTENVELALFNASGQQVATIFNGVVSNGPQQQQLNVGTLPAGSYQLVLRANGSVVTKTVTVVK